MDCHEPGTHWQLLGYYKESTYTKWFEQLFKHQGYCIWNNYDTYDFMNGYYNAWPRTCTETSTTLEDGSPLYYEMKPTSDANMTVGLYTDWRCAVEYTGDLKVENVLSDIAINADGNGDNEDNNENENWNAGVLMGEYESQWNEYMSVFKVCQPCRAYNLQINYASSGSDNDRKLDDSSSYAPNYGYFSCYDYAGYTGTLFACILARLLLETMFGFLHNNGLPFSFIQTSTNA
jgi:hypothetical protein